MSVAPDDELDSDIPANAPVDEVDETDEADDTDDEDDEEETG